VFREATSGVSYGLFAERTRSWIVMRCGGPLLLMDCNADDGDDNEDVGAREEHSFTSLTCSSSGSFAMFAAIRLTMRCETIGKAETGGEANPPLGLQFEADQIFNFS
jgi:hypothetical protein